MKLGKDFFSFITFFIKIIRLMMESFGDDEEKEVAKNNHIEV